MNLILILILHKRTFDCYQGAEKIQRLVLSKDRDLKVAACPTSKVIVTISNNSYDNLEVKPADYIDTSKKEIVESIN